MKGRGQGKGCWGGGKGRALLLIPAEVGPFLGTSSRAPAAAFGRPCRGIGARGRGLGPRGRDLCLAPGKARWRGEPPPRLPQACPGPGPRAPGQGAKAREGPEAPRLRNSAPESGEPPLGRPLQRAVAGAQQMRVGLVLLLQFQRGLLEAACWPPPSPNGRHRGKFAAPLRFLRPNRPPLVHSPAHLQLPLLLELLRELPLRVLPPPAPSGGDLQMRSGNSSIS